jgi:hypothetical protein
MEGSRFGNHKLPLLGDEEATDSAKIVAWAKAVLTSGKASPKLLERINILRYCVSEEVREMWAALTADIAGAPADDYPETIDPDSTEAEMLTKKREWHVEWLEAVISYYGTSQQDSVYEAVRQFVEWDRNPITKTRVKVSKWALSCSKAQKAVTSDAWSEADPKALFAACARVLPEPIRAFLQQNKPESGHHTWQTASKFLNQRTMQCEQDDAFRNAIRFVGTESIRAARGDGNSNSNDESRQRQQWRGKGGKERGQRGRGRSPNHPVTDEVAKEQTGGKGKAGKSTEKGGKPGGKAGGKAGKRKREGKGEAEPTPNKKKKADVECFNCGEKGHYKNQCRKPLRITDGSADADE